MYHKSERNGNKKQRKEEIDGRRSKGRKEIKIIMEEKVGERGVE